MMPTRTETVIKAVLFDLYGTLAYEARSEDSFKVKALKQLVNYLNSLSYDVELESFLRVYNKNLEEALRDIKDTLNEVDVMCLYWRTFKDLGINLTLTLVKECLDIFYSTEVKCMKLYPDVIPTLTSLRASKLKLAIVSNASLRFEYVISHLEISKYFDALVASYKVTKVKPHPTIFAKALSLLNVRPEETIMVGDTYETDIVAAKLMGMKAILIAREESVKERAK